MKRKRIFIYLVICLLCSWFIYWYVTQKPNNPIRLAVAGPFSGPNQSLGQSMVQGVQQYIDTINQQGGIMGRPLVIDQFDDEENPEKAQSIALHIADQNYLCVIGHGYSACSRRAGIIYKRYGIPAITPISTNHHVTKDNPWYFRTIFSDQFQGVFLANYIQQVLHIKEVCIIQDSSDYSSDLTQIFKNALNPLNIKVVYHATIQTNQADNTNQMNQIIKDLSLAAYQNSLIFLSTHESIGIHIIQSIKHANYQNPILASDAFAVNLFKDGFKDTFNEKVKTGYYTDNMMVSCPIMFNMADKQTLLFKEEYENNYHQSPDWIAAFAYDAAKVACFAIQKSMPTWENQLISFQRASIQKNLSKIDNPGDAIPGVTGLTYFDSSGSALKPIYIGMYKNSQLIPAYTQLKPSFHIFEMARTNKSTDIITVDGIPMRRMHVVYTGMDVNEISDIQLLKKACTITANIWFRFQESIPLEDIIFLNALSPISLNSPIVTLVENQITYQEYAISGTFLMDTFPASYVFNSHLVGIQFRHRTLSQDQLLFVPDLSNQKAIPDLYDGTYQLIETIDQQSELSTIRVNSNWTIPIKRSCQDRIEKSILGNPHYLNSDKNEIQFSRFTTWVQMTKNVFSIRGIFPLNQSYYLFIINASLILLLIVAENKTILKSYLKTMWFIQCVALILLLLSVEIIICNHFEKTLSSFQLSMIRKTFDILWWLIPTYLINMAIKRFLFFPLEARMGFRIPNIVPRFTSWIMYLLAFMGIIAFVFNQEISKLLATGGFFAMIIGLAVKMNISDVISGIVINLEAPFRIGDWIRVQEYEGEVVDITWRSTRIQTGENIILCIPNSKATESFIHNYNYPSDLNWVDMAVNIHHEYSPEHVQKILLDAVLSTPDVLKTPRPYIIYKGITDTAALYIIHFCINEYAYKDIQMENVWERIWVHLYYAGIAMTTQEENVVPPTERDILNSIALFNDFSDDEKNLLSNQMITRHYLHRDMIIQQGTNDDAFYIIKEGVVGVWMNLENGETIQVDQMGAGDYFGEKGLLGDIRTADIISETDSFVCVISKSAIKESLNNHPEFIDVLKMIHANRTLHREMQKTIYQESQIDQQQESMPMWAKIKQWVFGFFSSTQRMNATLSHS